MHVSRYIAPFSQHSLMSATLDTSTETLMRKSPRPSSGLSTRGFPHQRLGRGVDEEIPAPQQRIEHAAVVLAREPLLDELDAVPGGLLVPLVLRGHDREALGRNADVPQDQRQHALADAAKTHEQDPSWKLEK